MTSSELALAGLALPAELLCQAPEQIRNWAADQDDDSVPVMASSELALAGLALSAELSCQPPDQTQEVAADHESYK